MDCTVKLDFKLRCDKCGAALHGEFYEEHKRGVTLLVIVVEPCSECTTDSALVE